MSGLLGKSSLAPNAYQVVYTVPAGKIATLNISACNRGQSSTYLRVAVTNSGVNPLVADFIEHDFLMPGYGGVVERTAIVASPGEQIVCRSSSGNVSIRVHGFLEDV